MPRFLPRPSRLLAVAAAALLALPAAAQWTTQSNVNTAVSTVTAHTEKTQIVKGPSNGSYVLWSTYWTSSNIYLQFINSSGVRRSTDAHVSAGGHSPVMAADGSGGVIVAWVDSNRKIRAQRYDSLLNATWSTPATLATSGVHHDPAIVADGSGGALVSFSWRSSTSSTNTAIHAQRVDSSGVVSWNASNGFVVENLGATQVNSAIIPAIGSTRSGGAFVTWVDRRAGGTNYDIYIRYIEPSGTGSWGVSQPVVTAGYGQFDPQIRSDGAGGAIVAWRDDRIGHSELYAQRIASGGLHLWTPWNGVRIGNGINSLGFEIDSDGAGGIVAAWTGSASSGPDIHFQRVRANGTLQWGTGTTGLAITTNGTLHNQQILPSISGDGAGGAVIAWNTRAKTNSQIGDVYAQYVDPVSGVSWTAGGMLVSNAAKTQVETDVISDGECPAKITWTDYRIDGDPYIQRIRCPGILGVVHQFQHALTTFSFSSGNHLFVGGGSTGVGVGTTSDEGVVVLGPGGFDIAFDPTIVQVIGLEPGTVEELDYEIDAERGIVRVELPAGGESYEGEPLFELIVEGRQDGASALTLTRADGGEELNLLPSSTVLYVGEGGEG